MKTVRNLLETHPLLACFVLAFALSWGCLLLVIGPTAFVGLETIDEARMPLVYLAVLIGPSAAGLLLTGLVHGTEGLRLLRARLCKWRVSARWYAVALLTAPLAMMATLFVLSYLYPEIVPGIAATDNALSFILAGVAGGLAAGTFEELGWTGFAVPQLRRRYGVLVSGLIMGVLWGAWHFPLFAGNGRSAGTIPPTLYLLVLLFSFLPAYRVLMVWVYDRTGSLLVAMLMHMSLTASTLIFQPQEVGVPALLFDLVLMMVLYGVVAVVLVGNGRLSQQVLQKRTV